VCCACVCVRERETETAKVCVRECVTVYYLLGIAVLENGTPGLLDDGGVHVLQGDRVE